MYKSSIVNCFSNYKHLSRKIMSVFISALLSLSVFTACNSSEISDNFKTSEIPTISDVNFLNGDSPLFEPADGWCNGSMFNVTWRKENCTFQNQKMQLSINKDSGGAVPYSGGEYRSKDFYGFGRYEVSLKAIKNDGVVTSFFTYTGPSDNNPWDEIDVEILGKDTTKVQFNYFTNGVGNHEFIYDLGFDASEDFHSYAFEWRKDIIIWFVDGVEVYSTNVDIPSNKSKIMMNVWCGKGVDSWLKPFTYDSLPLTGEYQSISYIPFDE